MGGVLVTAIVNPLAPFAPLSTADTIVLQAGDMSTVLGGAARGAIARTAVWLFDASATEILGGVVRIPAHWRTFHIDFLWASLTATGAVSWRADIGALAAGSAVPDATAGAAVLATAGAAATTVQTRVRTSVAGVSGLAVWEAIRTGGDAGDTLAEDAGLIAVVLTRAS